MEQVPAPRPRHGTRILVAAGLLVAVTAIAVWIALRYVSPARLVAPGTPLVRLKVIVLDEHRHALAAAQTRIGVDEADAAQPKPSPDSSPSPASEPGSAWSRWRRPPTPTPEPSVRDATIRLSRAPIAISLYILDGPALLNWMEAHSQFVGSDLVQGIFQDTLRTLRVRGEDLKVPTIQGPVLMPLFRDVLSAGAALHYDYSRGRRGYVLAFDRRRSALAGRMLPLVLAAVGRREYRLPNADVSIVEALVGEQTFFVTEIDGMVYAGTSLPAVLNVIEMRPAPAPKGGGGTLVLQIHAEAWFRDLLPAITGANEWQATWTIDLRNGGSPGVIFSSGGTLFSYLRPEIAERVLASIPHDVFAAAAASFPFPQRRHDDGTSFFTRPSTAPPEPAGIGIVWDLSAKTPSLSDVGIIARGPAGDGATTDLANYLSDKTFATKCADGTIWLAATSELLLTRMREGCEGQSISMLRTVATPGAQAPELFLSLNPAVGVRELLANGIGTATQEREQDTKPAFTPAWRAAYDAAVQRARRSAETTLAQLPLLRYQGSANEEGATLTGTLEWPPVPVGGSS